MWPKNPILGVLEKGVMETSNNIIKLLCAVFVLTKILVFFETVIH